MCVCVYFSMMAKAVEKAGIRVISLMRNPKDVMVSCYHVRHFFAPMLGETDISFEYLLRFFSEEGDRGTIFNHIQSYWQMRDNPNFLILFYEDTVADYGESVDKIAKFLGKDVTPKQRQTILEYLNFSTYQKRQNKETAANEINRDTSHVDKFVRKGGVGGWKDHFTVAQNDMFNKLIDKHIGHLNIPFKYELN